MLFARGAVAARNLSEAPQFGGGGSAIHAASPSCDAQLTERKYRGFSAFYSKLLRAPELRSAKVLSAKVRSAEVLSAKVLSAKVLSALRVRFFITIIIIVMLIIGSI